MPTSHPTDRKEVCFVEAAVLRELGTPSFEDGYPEPEAGPGQLVIEVEAASLNPIDLVKASGKFMAGPPNLPSVVGDEGVGRTPDGQRVYFGSAVQPFGSMAGRCLVKSTDVVELPDGVDSAAAAAIGNTGVAAWLGLEQKACLKPGETVLVLGATGAVGRMGVQLAKLLGAGRVVAAGRNSEVLATLEDLGADSTVALAADTDPAEAITAAGGNADVVLDLLWGPPALAALKVAKPGVRLINIGQPAGAEIGLPAGLVRGKRAAILGHANASTPFSARAAVYQRLVESLATGQLSVDFERVPLAEVSKAWQRQAGPQHGKLVFDIS
jgi:NADPH:quinone reductase-like Zn-dependent oxidoreductase